MTRTTPPPEPSGRAIAFSADFGDVILEANGAWVTIEADGTVRTSSDESLDGWRLAPGEVGSWYWCSSVRYVRDHRIG